jgi:hypothetical protein
MTIDKVTVDEMTVDKMTHSHLMTVAKISKGNFDLKSPKMVRGIKLPKIM